MKKPVHPVTPTRKPPPAPGRPVPPVLEARQGLICAEGWEEALMGEVARRFPGRSMVSPGPGVVLISGDPAPLRETWVFAREVLPDAIELHEPSVKTLVQRLGEHVDRLLDASSLPWTFRVQTPDAWTLDGEAYAEVGGRAGLVAAAFLERMETFRRRAMERYREWPTLSARQPFVLIRCLVLSRERAVVSVGETFRNRDGERLPRPGPYPAAGIERDPRAPCRSYYKLEEAWLEAGREARPGELCVDLGAAPGGWSWAALRRGARVVAVDFADLDPRVAEHPRCTHLRENGYAWLPPHAAVWMLCDMIVRPLATLGLLERWLAGGHCRGFVVNVKFRGKDPSSIFTAIEELRGRVPLPRLKIRHLYYDRNEITLIHVP